METCNVPGYFLQFTDVERVSAQLKITTDAAIYCACPDADPADECKKHQHAFRAATGVAGGQSHRHRTTLHPGKPPRKPTNLTPAGLNRPVTQLVVASLLPALAPAELPVVLASADTPAVIATADAPAPNLYEPLANSLKARSSSKKTIML